MRYFILSVLSSFNFSDGTSDRAHKLGTSMDEISRG